MYEKLIWSIWNTFYANSLNNKLKKTGLWEDWVEEVRLIALEWKRQNEEDTEKALQFFNRSIRQFLKDNGFVYKKGWIRRELLAEEIYGA